MGRLRNFMEWLGGAIDDWGDQPDRDRERIEHRETVRKLEAQISVLERKVDEMRFNGPTLWKDEVEVLQTAMRARTNRGDIGHLSFADKAVIGRLLERCDQLPMTADELSKQVDGIITGAIETVPWESVFPEDSGKDVDQMPCHCGWDFNYGDTCPHGAKGQGV